MLPVQLNRINSHFPPLNPSKHYKGVYERCGFDVYKEPPKQNQEPRKQRNGPFLPPLDPPRRPSELQKRPSLPELHTKSGRSLPTIPASMPLPSSELSRSLLRLAFFRPFRNKDRPGTPNSVTTFGASESIGPSGAIGSPGIPVASNNIGASGAGTLSAPSTPHEDQPTPAPLGLGIARQPATPKTNLAAYLGFFARKGNLVASPVERSMLDTELLALVTEKTADTSALEHSKKGSPNSLFGDIREWDEEPYNANTNGTTSTTSTATTSVSTNTEATNATNLSESGQVKPLEIPEIKIPTFEEPEVEQTKDTQTFAEKNHDLLMHKLLTKINRALGHFGVEDQLKPTRGKHASVALSVYSVDDLMHEDEHKQENEAKTLFQDLQKKLDRANFTSYEKADEPVPIGFSANTTKATPMGSTSPNMSSSGLFVPVEPAHRTVSRTNTLDLIVSDESDDLIIRKIVNMDEDEVKREEEFFEEPLNFGDSKGASVLKGVTNVAGGKNEGGSVEELESLWSETEPSGDSKTGSEASINAASEHALGVNSNRMNTRIAPPGPAVGHQAGSRPLSPIGPVPRQAIPGSAYSVKGPMSMGPGPMAGGQIFRPANSNPQGPAFRPGNPAGHRPTSPNNFRPASPGGPMVRPASPGGPMVRPSGPARPNIRVGPPPGPNARVGLPIGPGSRPGSRPSSPVGPAFRPGSPSGTGPRPMVPGAPGYKPGYGPVLKTISGPPLSGGGKPGYINHTFEGQGSGLSSPTGSMSPVSPMGSATSSATSSVVGPAISAGPSPTNVSHPVSGPVSKPLNTSPPTSASSASDVSTSETAQAPAVSVANRIQLNRVDLRDVSKKPTNPGSAPSLSSDISNPSTPSLGHSNRSIGGLTPHKNTPSPAPSSASLFESRILEDPELEARYASGEGPCRRCGLEITGKSIWLKDGQMSGRWHRACFLCYRCNTVFAKGTNCYVIADKPYCHYDFHYLNHSLCKTCNGGIEGQCLENNNGERFHADCLKCLKCGVGINRDYFVLDGKALCEKDGMAEIEKEQRLEEHASSGGLAVGGLKVEKRRTFLLEMEPVVALT